MHGVYKVVQMNDTIIRPGGSTLIEAMGINALQEMADRQAAKQGGGR